MQLCAVLIIVVIVAVLGVIGVRFGFCSSADDCSIVGMRHILGIFFTVGAFGILGLLEFVVCFGA